MTQCLSRSAPAFDKDVLSLLPSSNTESTGFLARLYKITQGFRLEPTSMCPTSPMPTASYILISSYSEMQGLLEVVNRHAAAVGMRTNASKTKMMSAFIPGEQRQAVLLDGEPKYVLQRDEFSKSVFQCGRVFFRISFHRTPSCSCCSAAQYRRRKRVQMYGRS